jgi:hypothetical protein
MQDLLGIRYVDIGEIVCVQVVFKEAVMMLE